MKTLDQQAEGTIRRWKRDPVRFVRENFHAEPDAWQADFLQAFVTNNRLALKACKGPGKTTALAWAGWNFLATRRFPRCAATSISGDNLADNLWPELAKWQATSPFLSGAFEWTKTRIVSRQFPETWWMSARTWPRTADPQQQANTLAGLHADNTLAILDEVGGIPEAVMATADATLSTVGGEHKIAMAGNPTELSGPLYRACTSDRHVWWVGEITGDPDNPKRSSRVDITWARQQIATYGRDNPWVLVNVFGEFPPSSLTSLLGPDQVRAAMSKEFPRSVYQHAPRILGVDCGRFGGARSVIFPRQGMQAFHPVIMRPDRGQRDWTAVFAGRIAQAVDKWKADAVFIDDTGGWGAGVIDSLEASGYPVIPVSFAASAIDPRFRNRRAEMYFGAADWVKEGGSLPNLPELQREATASIYWFRNGVFQIEEKDQVMEKLGGDSPDLWDAFCLTFAQPIAAKTGIPWIDNRPGRAFMEREEELQT